jgi:hypothetical protein
MRREETGRKDAPPWPARAPPPSWPSCRQRTRRRGRSLGARGGAPVEGAASRCAANSAQERSLPVASSPTVTTQGQSPCSDAVGYGREGPRGAAARIRTCPSYVAGGGFGATTPPPVAEAGNALQRGPADVGRSRATGGMPYPVRGTAASAEARSLLNSLRGNSRAGSLGVLSMTITTGVGAGGGGARIGTGGFAWLTAARASSTRTPSGATKGPVGDPGHLPARPRARRTAPGAGDCPGRLFGVSHHGVTRQRLARGLGVQTRVGAEPIEQRRL